MGIPGMLGASYLAVPVNVQHKYVRCRLSDSSGNDWPDMLGAIYQNLAVNVQHLYVRCRHSGSRGKCEAPVC